MRLGNYFVTTFSFPLVFMTIVIKLFKIKVFEEIKVVIFCSHHHYNVIDFMYFDVLLFLGKLIAEDGVNFIHHRSMMHLVFV